MPPYHRPLDADRHEIRLIRIHPGPKESPVKCSVVHQSLLDPPNYAALSYPCGDVTDLRGITVDKVETAVYANLHMALIQLRELTIDLVWADAISINQEDKQEKSHQIRAIRHVYMKATRTYAWLGGDKSGKAVEAMEFLQSILTKADAYCPELRARVYWTSSQILRRSGSGIVDVFALVSLLPTHWLDAQFDFSDSDVGFRSLLSLLQRGYWRRRWIIQEVAVAGAVTVLCGSDSMTYDDLLMALAICRQSVHWSRQHQTGFYNLKQIYEIRKLYHRNEPIQLCKLLCQTRHFSSHDVRDVLFALLGISDDGPQLVPMPNYFQDPETIARDLTKAFLRTQRCFDMISLAGSMAASAVSSALPSWSVNWLDPSQLTNDLLCITSEMPGINPSAVIDNFRDDSNVIAVRGFPLGAISQMTSILGPQRTERDEVQLGPFPRFQNDEAMTTAPESFYYTTAQAEDAVLQCLFSRGIWDLARGYPSNRTPYVYRLFLNQAIKSLGGPHAVEVQQSDPAFRSYGKWMTENTMLTITRRSVIYRLRQPHSLDRLKSAIVNWPLSIGAVVMFCASGILLIFGRTTRQGLVFVFLVGVAILTLYRLTVIAQAVYRTWKEDEQLAQGLCRSICKDARQLAVTKRGVVAMTSIGTKVGDQLCVFAGCKYASVVRPLYKYSNGGRALYRVVGRASLPLNRVDYAKYCALKDQVPQDGSLEVVVQEARNQMYDPYNRDPWWYDFELE